MTGLLERAVQTARSMPADMQNDIARMILLFAGDEPQMAELAPEEEAAVLHSRAAAARGEFASDDQIRAIWAKHGP